MTQLIEARRSPRPTPIDSGSSIVVEVDYSGTPVRLTDIDGSYEGWIPACYGPGQTPPCDGGFVVNEPNGAQAWFPNNNYPTDKATFDTTITVPVTHTALGIGELASRVDNGDGTWTWSWSEDTPDGDLPDDGDRRPVQLLADVDDRDVDQPSAGDLQRRRLVLRCRRHRPTWRRAWRTPTSSSTT